MSGDDDTTPTAERDGVSVLVSTRDRPDELRRCVASVLDSDHERFEIIVVDQSSDVVPLRPDPRLRHVRSATRGKSAGLNVALSMASYDHVAFTDDDCTVPPEWLALGSRILVRNSDVALVFGCLDALPHDPSDTFVPTARFVERRRVRQASRAYRRGGAGANMFSRRAHVVALGGFDEMIGPGARYPACEEYDLYFRTLVAGCTVLFEPDLAVVHWNGRPYADGSGRALLRSYAYGEGAVIGKHIRARRWAIVPVLGRIVLDDVAYLGGNLVRGRLTGAGLLSAKLRGIAARVIDSSTPAHARSSVRGAVWPT